MIHVSPPPPPPPPAPPRRLLYAVGLAVAAVVAFLLGRLRPAGPELPALSTSHVDARPTPNVLVAVRELARLETATYHMERVVEMTDEQTKLFGLMKPKDSLLLVAVGDVTAGVDLAKVADGDVTVMRAPGEPTRARLVLPDPEIFSAALDASKTHVFDRATDTFASRNEGLEGRARAEAEGSMRRAALEEGILDRARGRAERDLQALLRSLGFDEVEIVWP